MKSAQPDFDLGLALRLAKSALGAYETPEQIRARGAIPVCSSHYDLQAVVENHEDCTVLAFRGTRSRSNWMVDLNAIPDLSGLHSGINRAYHSFDHDVFQALPRVPSCLRPGSTVDHSKPFYITGHSLGGALALDAAVTDYFPDAVYTFGQPRLLTRRYLARDEDHYLSTLNLWRVVDREDIVPHLPGLLAGYRHIGGLALIAPNSAGLLDISYNPSFLRQIEGHAKGIAADLYRVHCGKLPEWVLLKDHSMQLYTDALGAVAKRINP